jgi:hypothetical protein
MRSNLQLVMVCVTVGLATISRGASITTIADASVPVSDPNSVFDVDTHPGNVYGLGPGTTLNPNGFDVRDLFGGAYTSLANEVHNVIFNDQTGGFVNRVVVALASPVQLTGYDLYLAEDISSGSRNTRAFNLYASATLLDSVTILDNSGNQTFAGVYGNKNLKISNVLANSPLSSSYTFEFVQNQSQTFGGVRALEFVAYVPEPSSFSILTLGLFALCRNRSKRIRNAS